MDKVGKRSIVDGQIYCTKCKSWKDLKHYGIDKSKPTGYRHECLDCRAIAKKKYTLKPEVKEKSRDYNLKLKYNISLEDYNNILEKQNGRCAICNELPKVQVIQRKGARPIVFDTLVVDHDHETGEVRGLLCRECNLALGHFKDKLTNLTSAITYLSKEKE